MPTQTKSAKSAKSSASTPFDAFNVYSPTLEVPAGFRDFAEKSAAQAQDNYAKFKTAAEEVTEMADDTYETARRGAVEFSAKALDMAKANSEAAFSLARDLFGAKSFAEAAELQSDFARNQFDVFGTQAKEFQALSQKYVTDSAKQVEKTLKNFKVA